MVHTDRRAFLKAAGSAATLGVLAGCSGGGGGGGTETTTSGGGGGTSEMTTTSGGATTTSGGGGGEPITIGALEPISGPFAAWATDHRDGLQYAVNEINDNGGVMGGRQLQVKVSDTGADPAKADSEFRRLVEQEGAVATTGSVSSDVGLRVSQTAADLSVPHFLHMSGTDGVITKDTQYVFRVGLLPASNYLKAQATAFADAGYTKIAAICADYAWGHAAADAIQAGFDVDVQIEFAPVPPSTDFSSYIRKLPQDIEMLIASGHPPGCVPIANKAFELGYSPKVVTGASNPPISLVNGLSDAAFKAFVHIHNSDPYEQAFADAASAFAKNHDAEFSTHTAYGYVTAKLIANGIEQSSSADPSNVADGVRNNKLDSLFANPVQYNQYGELDNTIVFFSRLKKQAPSFDPNGTFSYEKLHESDAVSARVPSK